MGLFSKLFKKEEAKKQVDMPEMLKQSPFKYAVLPDRKQTI